MRSRSRTSTATRCSASSESHSRSAARMPTTTGRDPSARPWSSRRSRASGRIRRRRRRARSPRTRRCRREQPALVDRAARGRRAIGVHRTIEVVCLRASHMLPPSRTHDNGFLERGSPPGRARPRSPSAISAVPTCLVIHRQQTGLIAAQVVQKCRAFAVGPLAINKLIL